jgi:hypothetical protein
MEQLEIIYNLVKDAGYIAEYSYNNKKINILNKNQELIGQMVVFPNDNNWFYVFDTVQGQITPEGGQFNVSLDGVKNIIEEFRYR